MDRDLGRDLIKSGLNAEMRNTPCMGISQAREAFIGIEEGKGSDRSFAKAKIVRVRINNEPFDMIQRACDLLGPLAVPAADQQMEIGISLAHCLYCEMANFAGAAHKEDG